MSACSTTLKRIAVGLVAGAAATAVMDKGQTTLIPAVSSWIGRLSGDHEPGPSQVESPDPATEDVPESSPERVAHRLADMLDVSVSRKRLKTLGNRIHWIYGTQWGVPYVLLPVSSGPGSGLLYGAALWLGSDELLLWGTGIAGKPTSYPLSTHAKALAAHLLYGIMLGTTVRTLESASGTLRQHSS